MWADSLAGWKAPILLGNRGDNRAFDRPQPISLQQVEAPAVISRRPVCCILQSGPACARPKGASVKLLHFVAAPKGVPEGAAPSVLPVRCNNKTEDTMERALFEQWTENRLRAAFRAANAGPDARREDAFRRGVAYIAMLTGGTEPPTA
jgi:hypothetical protein